MRGAVDHGIESPDERAQTGKPARPTLTLSAVRSGDTLVVDVCDDGRGIAWKKLAQKLTALGLPANDNAQLTDGLFVDGVSTSDSTTDVSGRGIGMTALKAAMVALGGAIEVHSAEGAGTTLSCRLPLSAEPRRRMSKRASWVSG